MKKNSKKWLSRKLICLGIACAGINDVIAGDALRDNDPFVIIENFFQGFVPRNAQRVIGPDIENGLAYIVDETLNDQRRVVGIIDFMRDRGLHIEVVNGQLVLRPLQPAQENYVVNQITQFIQFIRNRNIYTLCAGGYVLFSVVRDIYNTYAMYHSPEAS